MWHDRLLKKIEESGRAYRMDVIEKAFSLADAAHQGQKRESGDPYISHPASVAEILIEIGMDTDSVVAALLHDVIEDTGIGLSSVEKEFGPTVALLVDGVTKLGNIPYSTHEEEQAENVRKMLLAMSEDIRVIIIKLADRLHNMRTLSFMPEQKRRDKAKETMEIYAPLAHRLGMQTIKEELEDISLRYLDTVAYEEIEELLDKRALAKGETLALIRDRIYEKVRHICPGMQIEARVKSVYGIYRKMYIQGRSLDEIYDIYAIRIIVDTVEECYGVLGQVHEMYRLIPNRFKDYISTPKQNMYQSLHTTVLGSEGVPIEVQIRTWRMHQTAEYGIAAHWKYKIGAQADDKLDDRLSWIRAMLQSQQEQEGAEDIVRTIKNDLAPEDTFVLTPKGGIISLPIGATVIDFAYAIHTAVGNKMTGAKVDGRIVPLDYQLKTGEVVEILTTKSQTHGPSRDWLQIAKTSEARGKIRSWFKKERREENIEEGKAALEREFRRAGFRLSGEEAEALIEEIARRQHCSSVEEMYAAIGYGGLLLSKIMPRLRDELARARAAKNLEPEKLVISEPRRPRSSVVVEGLDNCLVKLSKCCTPLPGEPIIGFVTRGYGVSIHRADCVNVTADSSDPETRARWVSAHWAGDADGVYKATVEIVGVDRFDLLADVSVCLSSFHLPIYNLNAKVLKNKNAFIAVTVGLSSVEQLATILSKLKKVQGVITAERAQG